MCRLGTRPRGTEIVCRRRPHVIHDKWILEGVGLAVAVPYNQNDVLMPEPCPYTRKQWVYRWIPPLYEYIASKAPEMSWCEFLPHRPYYNDLLMSTYVKNGENFGWGVSDEPLNPEKTALLDRYARGTVLDIGCAVGRYTDYLARSGHKVTGIDTERALISRAKKNYPRLSFAVGSAYHLPKAPRRYGTVLLFDILEHIDDRRALAEAARVGKRIIISVPHENQSVLTRFSLAHHHYMDHTHRRTYTPQSLRELLVAAGFRVRVCRAALPVSVHGLAITHFSRGSRIRALVLRILLKPFMPEAPLYSTVFAVADRGGAA